MVKKLYRCPYECGDPRYPRPKWKTERGYLKHLESCPSRPEAVQQREEAALERLAVENECRRVALSTFLHRVGDDVVVMSYRVTKPTRERRGRRMVRIRYEEERKYFAKLIKIRSLEYSGGVHGHIVINDRFSARCIRDDLRLAESEAKERQDAYDRGCREASSFR